MQWVPGALSPGVKRQGSEADHSPPSSAEVNAWSHISTASYVFMAWYLVKLRDDFMSSSLLRREVSTDEVKVWHVTEWRCSPALVGCTCSVSSVSYCACFIYSRHRTHYISHHTARNHRVVTEQSGEGKQKKHIPRDC
jgi:hypothetical protein